MKVVSSLFAALFLLLGLHCNADTPASINGMSDVPLGSGTDRMFSMMDQRGAHFFHNRSTSTFYYFEGGSFENKTAATWNFRFSDGKLYESEVTLSPGDNRLQLLAEIKKALVEKYGDPVADTKVKMDDAALVQAINQGKLTLSTTWVDAATGHSMICSLGQNHIHYVLLRITYQDDKVAKQLKEKEKGDL